MRHIIYMTTAMDELDFKEYLKHWKISPNPSNQNFHNKLIRSLALTNKVDVVSIRPFSTSLCDVKKLKSEVKVDNNITWHYLKIQRTLIHKYLTCQRELNKLFANILDDETIIFTDTINTSVIHFLKHAIKRYKNIKIIGVVTDSPSNISGVGRSYARYVLNNTNNYAGYISLTEELNDLYNPNQKPHMVMEGIIEDKGIKYEKPSENYFFFGGALMERYGIYNLIKAFNKFNATYKDYKLYISGHHADLNRMENEVKNNPNIKYLKMLPVDEVLRLEKMAKANINPRPYSEDLDRYSIPSKTIEYLVSERPTICVKNTKLAKYFLDEIIWAKTSDVDDLYDALISVASANEKDLEILAKKGKEKALNNFSLKAINNRIETELLSVFDK